MTEFQNGYGPFPATLVISSERSGLNLIRHACEVLSGGRTPGKVHLKEEGPLLFHRTHNAGHAGPPSRSNAPLFGPDRASTNYSKALLLLRAPAETYVRAYNKNPDLMKLYCANIRLFDAFELEKLTITYDALITGDQGLKNIFTFLGIADTFDASKLTEIRKDAVAWYDKNQPSGSQTRGDPSLLKAHQAFLSPDERSVLRDCLKRELGDLAKVYLSSWDDV